MLPIMVTAGIRFISLMVLRCSDTKQSKPTLVQSYRCYYGLHSCISDLSSPLCNHTDVTMLLHSCICDAER